MKASKTQGYYTFEDGYKVWLNGMSAQERKVQIYKHGKIIRFEQTNI